MAEVSVGRLVPWLPVCVILIQVAAVGLIAASCAAARSPTTMVAMLLVCAVVVRYVRAGRRPVG